MKNFNLNLFVYYGYWVDDKAQGQGTYVHLDGTKYEGEFLNDKKHGHGVEIWLDGSRYEGNYVQGVK